MNNSNQNGPAGLMALIERRMEAINAGDPAGVAATYDDQAAFRVNVDDKDKDLLGKPAIVAWLSGLPERVKTIRTEQTMEWDGTHVVMTCDIIDRATDKVMFRCRDLFWGDADRIVRHEAHWNV